MDVFFELRFRLDASSPHPEVAATIEDIPGVDILLDHSRELGWFERPRLLVSEWDCRIVVWVYERYELEVRDRTGGDRRDPYRTVDFDGPRREVPTKLVELMESLDARYDLVSKGWLRFETRHYERALLEQLEADLRAIAKSYVKVEVARATGSLRGRLHGRIPVIRQLQRHLQRSGMVDFDRILVGYE